MATHDERFLAKTARAARVSLLAVGFVKTRLLAQEKKVVAFVAAERQAGREVTYSRIMRGCALSSTSVAFKLVRRACDKEWLTVTEGRIELRTAWEQGPGTTITLFSARDFFRDHEEAVHGMLALERRIFSLHPHTPYIIGRLRFDEKTALRLRTGTGLLLRCVSDWLKLRRISRPRWALVKFRGRNCIRRIRFQQDPATYEWSIELYRDVGHVDIIPAPDTLPADLEVHGLIEGLMVQNLSVRAESLRDFLDYSQKQTRKWGGGVRRRPDEYEYSSSG